MKYITTNIRQATLWLVIGLALGSVMTQALHAQQGIQRAILFRSDVAAASTPMELVLGTAEIPIAGHAGRHTHAGIELGYVLSGAAVMEVAGMAPRALQPGDVFYIPAGTAHDATVIGTAPVKVLAFYLVEKGKPLAVAVP